MFYYYKANSSRNRFRKFSLLRRRYHCGKISCGYGSNIGVLKEQGKKRRGVNILSYNDILNRIPRCFSPLTPKKEEKKNSTNRMGLRTPIISLRHKVHFPWRTPRKNTNRVLEVQGARAVWGNTSFVKSISCPKRQLYGAFLWSCEL